MVNVNGNDPLESFFNSIELVKNAFGPIESGFRKAAKDLENRWPGGKNGRKTGEMGVFDVKSDERKKGLSNKVPFKTFIRVFTPKDGKEHKGDMSKNEDGSCVNCMNFGVTWSLLVSSFVQAVPEPLRNGKKKLQKKNNGDKLSRDRNEFIAKGAFGEIVSSDRKGRKLENEVLMPCEETLKIKDGNGLSLEHFIGFVLEQLAQNLHKFELGFLESGSEKCDVSTVPYSTIQVDHLKAVGSLLEGKKADVSGFLGTLKFARVGGVPSGIVDVTSPVKDESDADVSSNVTEENVSSFSQKMANGLLSIPSGPSSILVVGTSKGVNSSTSNSGMWFHWQ